MCDDEARLSPMERRALGRLDAHARELRGDLCVLLDAEPEVARLYALLTDDGIPDAVKALVRSNLAITASQLEAWT